MRIAQKTAALTAALMFLSGIAAAETVTLQATLESDTYFASNSPDSKYASITTSITNQPYFYCARDYSSVTRFAAFRWRLPVCPPNMRVSEVRLNIYSQAGTGGAGTLGFAALNDNPNLTVASWNTCVNNGYIIGRNATTYVVQLGANAVGLAETLTNATSVWRWNTLRSSLTSSSGLTNTLAEQVSDTLSPSSSNTLTLLTLPLSGNGLTEWHGGSLEAGSNTVMEIDFVPADIALSVPVTNNLLVALQSSSAMKDGDGGVAIWPDAASLGGWQDFSQIATNNRPVIISTNMPNGKTLPVLDFTQANVHHLELGATPTFETNTLTWFAVFKPDMAGAGNTRTLLSSAYTDVDYLWGTLISGTTGAFTSFSRTSGGTMMSASFQPDVSNQWFVMSGTWNGRSESLNGNAAQSVIGRLLAQDRKPYANATVTGVNALPAGHRMTRIGRLSGGEDTSRLFDGQMAELLIYNTALSAADADAVMEYLDLKYFKRLGTLIKVY
jgi:hypothetical protein